MNRKNLTSRRRKHLWRREKFHFRCRGTAGCGPWATIATQSARSSAKKWRWRGALATHARRAL